jgi:nitroreductase
MNQIIRLMRKRRTIRKFKSQSIDENFLIQMVDAARFAPSVSNIQPCEYIIIYHSQKIHEVFECVDWSEAAAPFEAPKKHEQPASYIIILIDMLKKSKCGPIDAASAATYILLAAAEKNVGTCWIRSINRKKLKKYLRIPHHLHVDSIIALGFPDEHSVVEELIGPTHVWKDKEGVVHVPKRSLEDICHMNGYTNYYSKSRNPIC